MATAPAQSSQVACTPSPQKATVFNVAEYKRQLQQQQQHAKPAAASVAKAEPAKASPAKPAAAAPAKAASDAPAIDYANPGTPLMKVEAKYDFEGNAAKHEVSFQKGDFITVYGKGPCEGWWVGRVQGEKTAGLCPANYVKLVKKFA